MMSNYIYSLSGYPPHIHAMMALLHYQSVTIPINVIKLAESIKNLRVMTYSEFCKRRNITIREAKDILRSEEGALTKHPTQNKYILYYNDTQKYPNRTRFTIAHELGHYFLNHLAMLNDRQITRGLSKKELKPYEDAADEFAGILLLPPPLYQRMRLGNVAIGVLCDIFRISKGCARNRQRDLDSNMVIYSRASIFNLLQDRYLAIMSKIYYMYNCSSCGSFHSLGEIQKYCIICGSNKIRRNLLIESGRGGLRYMKYEDGYEVNEEYKTKRCPRCENEEIYDGDHCIICGIKIVNRCTAEDYNYVCAEPLPGNARYCHKCGGVSTFFKTQLLKPYERYDGSNPPKPKDIVADLFNSDDDELPF